MRFLCLLRNASTTHRGIRNFLFYLLKLKHSLWHYTHWLSKVIIVRLDLSILTLMISVFALLSDVRRDLIRVSRLKLRFTYVWSSSLYFLIDARLSLPLKTLPRRNFNWKAARPSKCVRIPIFMFLRSIDDYSLFPWERAKRRTKVIYLRLYKHIISFRFLRRFNITEVASSIINYIFNFVN